MNSVWSETAKKPVFEVQKGDLKTNVLVIGAGLCGILTAYYLRARGVDCLVCEADEICGGATRNTTAKVTVAHGLIYESILCRFGRKIAQGYLRAQSEALEEYRRLSRLYPCDFEEVDSFVYSKTDRAATESEVDAINGAVSDFGRKVGCPTPMNDCVVDIIHRIEKGELRPCRDNLRWFKS